MTNTRSKFWRFIHNAVVHPMLEFLPEFWGDFIHDETAHLAFYSPQEKRMNKYERGDWP